MLALYAVVSVTDVMKYGTIGVNAIFLRNIMTREELHDISTC
jgi:hypothetical protein